MQVSLMAYLPKQKCRIIEKNGEQLVCNSNISDQHFTVISIIVTKKGF